MPILTIFFPLYLPLYLLPLMMDMVIMFTKSCRNNAVVDIGLKIIWLASPLMVSDGRVR